MVCYCEKKSTTLLLGVTIIDKILSSMQEVMKNSSRCDRCHSHERGIDYHNNLTKHALHIVQQKTTAYLALHTVRSMYDQPLRTCAPTKWRPHESFNRNCSLCLQSDLSWTLNATLQRLLNANRRGRRRPEPSSPLRRHPPPTPAHPLQLRTISPTCHCPVLFVHCHRVIAVHQQDVHRDIRTSLIPTLVNLKIRRRMESKKQPTEPRRRRGATLQRSREPRRRRLPNATGGIQFSGKPRHFAHSIMGGGSWPLIRVAFVGSCCRPSPAPLRSKPHLLGWGSAF